MSTLQPGRDLDRMIAERIFGRDPDNARHGLHDDGDIEYSWGYPLGHDVAPHYSTSVADAWLIVEHFINPDSPFAAQKWSFGLEYSCVVDFVASFDFTPRARHVKARDYPAFQAEATSMPLAICRAALMAVS